MNTLTNRLQEEGLERCINLEFIPKDVFLAEIAHTVAETLKAVMEVRPDDRKDADDEDTFNRYEGYNTGVQAYSKAISKIK